MKRKRSPASVRTSRIARSFTSQLRTIRLSNPTQVLQVLEPLKGIKLYVVAGLPPNGSSILILDLIALIRRNAPEYKFIPAARFYEAIAELAQDHHVILGE